MKIVAVTSCPTGIAHTYMAAEALENAANEMGIEIFVETQGSAGIAAIEDEAIASADAAIFAADIGVRGRDRFEHLPIYEVGVKIAINQPSEVIKEAISRIRPKSDKALPEAKERLDQLQLPDRAPSRTSIATTARQWLMTGMSYAIPAIAVGGAFTTVARWLDHRLPPTVTHLTNRYNFELIQSSQAILRAHHFAGALFLVGLIAMALAIPILSAFTAYAISDRPALIPGLIGGFSAAYLGGGYIAGIVVGIIAGFSTRMIGKVNFPEVLRAVVPTTITPIIATFATSLLSMYVVAPPSRAVNHLLIDAMSRINFLESLLVGSAIGAMMAADLGGPINKVAYSIGILLLLSGNYLVMAAVIASGVVPPIGLSLAAILTPKRFTDEERKAAPLSLVIGSSLVTERAIAYTKSGYRGEMISAAVVGASVTGALSMVFKVTSPMPHGGFLVFYLFGEPGLFALAVGVGSILTTLLAIVFRTIGSDRLVQTKP